MGRQLGVGDTRRIILSIIAILHFNNKNNNNNNSYTTWRRNKGDWFKNSHPRKVCAKCTRVHPITEYREIALVPLAILPKLVDMIIWIKLDVITGFGTSIYRLKRLGLTLLAIGGEHKNKFHLNHSEDPTAPPHQPKNASKALQQMLMVNWWRWRGPFMNIFFGCEEFCSKIRRMEGKWRKGKESKRFPCS